MFSLSDDPSRIQLFEKYADFPLPEDDAPLRLLEWKERTSHGESITIERATDLEHRPDCALRIIFAPLDLPESTTMRSLLYLFNKYYIPSNFISERLQSVARSFGSKTYSDGSECLWYHFLCKNINTEQDPLKPQYVTIKNPVYKPNFKGQSQADFSWIRAAFFLKFENAKTDDEDPSVKKSITLICFGASESLFERFSRLRERAEWNEALQDPIVLFDIVLDELYLQLDGVSWNLNEVYGDMERVRPLYLALV